MTPTPTPTHTAVPHVQATAPERIYLVIGEDVEPDTDFDDLGRGMESDGVTWCADKIDDNSIPYVRADLASLPAPQGEQPDFTGKTLYELVGDEAEVIAWSRLGRTMKDVWRGHAGVVNCTLSALRERASQDSRTPTVAPGGLPLAQPNSQDGDSVPAPVEPPGATLSPCAASQPQARPLSEWEEDMNDVLWWRFPVDEPPYCGTPNCDTWPGYHTHWTPLVVPSDPTPVGESSSERGAAHG